MAGSEYGADIIKPIYICGKLRKVVEGCHKPFVILGGDASERELLTMIRDSLRQRKGTIGRSIWKHPAPENITGLLQNHYEGASVEEALEVVWGICYDK